MFQEGPNQIIPYCLVNAETGKWNRPKIYQYPNYAVKSFVNNLTLRVDNIISKAVRTIHENKGLTLKNRIIKLNSFKTSIESYIKELQYHERVCNQFSETVLKVVEIKTPFLNCQEILKNTISTLSKIINCWNEILVLSDEKDPDRFISKMKAIKLQLDSLSIKPIHQAMTAMDDAANGLLRIQFPLQPYVDLGDISDRFVDYIVNEMIQGVNHFPDSDESKLVNKAFDKIVEFGILNTPYIELLKKVQEKLEFNLEGIF